MAVMCASIVMSSESMSPRLPAEGAKGIVDEHTSIEGGLGRSEKEREE